MNKSHNYKNVYNSNNYHFQDHHMFPGLKRGHNRRTWIQCRSLQRQRTGATHEHTRPSLAIRRRLHYRCLAAESWRGPCDDFHKTFSTEMDCSKSAALPCTWCAPAPNNWTMRNGPCVWPILAAPMLQQGQLPDTISGIICIRLIIRIIVTGIKMLFKHFFLEWLLPPLDLEPRSAKLSQPHKYSADRWAKIAIQKPS